MSRECKHERTSPVCCHRQVQETVSVIGDSLLSSPRSVEVVIDVQEGRYCQSCNEVVWKSIQVFGK